MVCLFYLSRLLWPGNGGSGRLGEKQTLDALLAEKTADTLQRGIAVALNGAIVPRAAWRAAVLRAGDSVEIVRARQGG